MSLREAHIFLTTANNEQPTKLWTFSRYRLYIGLEINFSVLSFRPLTFRIVTLVTYKTIQLLHSVVHYIERYAPIKELSSVFELCCVRRCTGNGWNRDIVARQRTATVPHTVTR